MPFVLRAERRDEACIFPPAVDFIALVFRGATRAHLHPTARFWR